jgi:4-hydroxybenzoate polyprenyltransferase
LAGRSDGLLGGERIAAAELLADVPRQYSVGGGLRYPVCDGRRDDDVKIGIKSTAILFGEHDRTIIGMLQVGCWRYGRHRLAERAGLGILLVAVYRRGLFGWQQKLIFNRERDDCFKAFMNNNYVGLVLFLGLAMSYLQ